MSYLLPDEKPISTKKKTFKIEREHAIFEVEAYSKEEAERKADKKEYEMGFKEREEKGEGSTTAGRLAAGILGNAATGATWGASDIAANKIPGFKLAKADFNHFHPYLSGLLDFGTSVASGGVIAKGLSKAGMKMLAKSPFLAKLVKAGSNKMGKAGNWVWDKILHPDLSATGHVLTRRKMEKIANDGKQEPLTPKQMLQIAAFAPLMQAGGRTLGKVINANKGRGEYKYDNIKKEVGEGVIENAKANSVRPIELDDEGVWQTMKHAATDPEVNDKIRRLYKNLRSETSTKVDAAHKGMFGHVADSSKKLEELNQLKETLYKSLVDKWGNKKTIDKTLMKKIQENVSPEVLEAAKHELNQYRGYKSLPVSSFKRLQKTAQVIKDASDTHFNQGKKHLATEKGEQSKVIRDVLGEADPNYTKANEAFGTMKRIEEAHAKGLNAKELTEELIGEIATMAPDEQNAFMDGMRKAHAQAIKNSNVGERGGVVNVRNRAFTDKQLNLYHHMLGKDKMDSIIKPLDRHINTTQNLNKALNWSKGDVNAGNEVHGYIRAKKRPENFIAKGADDFIKSSNYASPKDIYEVLTAKHDSLDRILGKHKASSDKARSLNRAAGAGFVKGFSAEKPRRVAIKQAAPAIKKMLGYDVL
jgi:hypothetical protein